MKVSLFSRYMDITEENTKGRSVIVIDVYRTTTVIVTALSNGASEIIPTESIDEAWKISRELDSEQILLAGEREAIPIDGFQLDNSPFSYTKDRVLNKTIIMSTSNGTRAIKVSSHCDFLCIASFLNIAPVVSELMRREKDVCIVCSGTMGNFSLEDGLCAGMILSRMSRLNEIQLTDLGWAMKELAERNIDIREALEKGSLAYRYLRKTNYIEDIEYCLRVDLIEIVPVLDPDGRIRKH
jgi:2-phosphosulfolactate phosphatase